MPKKVTITPEVRAVLEHGIMAGNTFRLPQTELPRDLYLDVNKVLVALGGKWNKKVGGHVFPGEGDVISAALDAGVAVDKKRSADQFFTPPKVADRLFMLAQLMPLMHVLEPSAGAGALLAEPMRLGCIITAVEKDRDLAINLKTILSDRSYRSGSVLHCADFMEWEPRPTSPPIDRVIMNPPFSGGVDIDHVTRALGYLRKGGVLVAIMSPHWTFAEDKRSREFRLMLDWHKHDWEPLPDGSFKEAGTMVSTGILTIRKGN